MAWCTLPVSLLDVTRCVVLLSPDFTSVMLTDAPSWTGKVLGMLGCVLGGGGGSSAYRTYGITIYGKPSIHKISVEIS